MKKIRCCISLLILTCLGVTPLSGAKTFVTEGNAIRKMVPGMINKTPVLFLGELDGSVSCYTTTGTKLWRHETKDPAVLFELAVADLDGDGRDELLTASGDGTVGCWSFDGDELWRFRPGRKVRLNEVAVLARGAETRIYAGGNDKVIYVLDRDGNLLTTQDVPGAIRKLEIGDFQQDGEPLLFVMTMKHDKSGWISFDLRNPDQPGEVVISLPTKKRPKRLKGIITEIRVQDMDRDGRDDLMVFINDSPVFCAVNGKFQEITGFDLRENPKEARRSKQRYAHTTGTSLYPLRNEILMQFGRAFYLLDEEGNLLDWSGSTSARFPAADFCVHHGAKRLFAAGSVGGDNAVYEFDLTDPQWWKQHERFVGRLADVTENLETLYQQAISFTPPAYQKKTDRPWVMGISGEMPPEVQALDFSPVVRPDEVSWGENHDRSHIESVVGPEWVKKRDRRKNYKDTREVLVARAQDYESRKQPFIVWAGHGGDPFYMSIGTLEAILEAAPTTCYGFTYAEMANTKDPRVHYFIDYYMPRLAAACRKQGRAKLYFRYKQTFWATTVQAHPWNELFLSGQYADVLVPGTEDTNSTTQDLNLAGRVGMLASGCIDNFAMRLIDDNPTGWRPLAPCRQKTISPYLRSGVMRAAYGARYGLIWGFKGMEGPHLELLVALMASGVLPDVTADNLASIGSWHLMKQVPHDVHEREHLGHTIDQYMEQDFSFVQSVVHVHWGGASVPEFDFSRRALGVKYRWLHFVPELPYGMVPIAPTAFAAELQKRGDPYIVSDSKAGFVDGQPVPAVEFGDHITRSVTKGAARMPVVVKGASWSAIWIDAHHLRVILLDPHYLDPRDCPATIQLQKPFHAAHDILSGDELTISGTHLSLTVPAGSIRVVDLSL